MDLQITLESIARLLIKDFSDSLKVVMTRPCKENLYNYTVTVNCLMNKNHLTGGGVSKNILEAFLKALVELGESFIMYRDNFPDRSGIAGGLTEKNTILRAKSELLERDSFLFHYQNKIPFLSQEKVKVNEDELIKFELATIDPEFSTIFITNHACALGQNKCLLSGTGSHLSKKIATQKAIEEYSTMKMIHEKYPKWCDGLESVSCSEISAPDFHHLNSKDQRNKKRIGKICEVNLNTKRQQQFNSHDWKISKLVSPLRFFHYFRVEHPGIKKMEFMQPEISDDSEGTHPLYHPFW
jgi:hypothetical protein